MTQRILVPVKQVPGTTHVNIDPATGTLIRSGVESKMNPYDLYALETAVRLKETLGATVCAVTMGPPQAEEILREALMMGADEACLVTDRAFAGADVLATSYTLARAADHIGGVTLVICGKQTTDGDTAQVGPAMAEHLQIPHVAWVTTVEGASQEGITVRQELSDCEQLAFVPFPCLITVEKTVHQPRLLSYKRKVETRDWPVRRLTRTELGGDAARYGLEGSPTQVEAIFTPEHDTTQQRWQGDAATLAEQLRAHLAARRIIEA